MCIRDSKNSGGMVYDDEIGNCVILVDAQGRRHAAELVVQADSGIILAALARVYLDPGEKTSGWVYYALKPNQKPRTLKFTADSGYGPDVGKWSLR